MRAGYQPIGAASVERSETAHWRFVARDGTRAEVALLADDLVRVRLLPPGVVPAPSWAVLERAWPAPTVDARQTAAGDLVVSTPLCTLRVTTAPLRITCAWPDGTPFAEDAAEGMGTLAATDDDQPSADFPPGSVFCAKRLAPGERILGAGEQACGPDQRGQRLRFYNVDPPQPHTHDMGPLYVSVPFWLGLRGGRAYGIFLDSVRRTELDVGATAPDRLTFGADGGDLTYYVFAGPTPAAVLARYSDLTGRMPLPPRWALGYGQSRWSYAPEERLREVAAGFRQRGIPCDTLWLDIDYMQGYRVFTWSAKDFPDPAGLLADLRAAGFKVITILDPGVKVDEADPTYAEGLRHGYFVRQPDGAPFTGLVWPGLSAFPDFTRADVRAWWGEQHRALLEAGVAGIWDDMNEPALTDFLTNQDGTPHGTTMAPDALHLPDGPEAASVPHAALHNAYGLQMARATYEGMQALRPQARPFVLTRSGYAGVQRYAAVWTGDNRSTWEHLRLGLRISLGLGLSGVPFVGSDTGGFFEDATPELLVRSTQLGALLPFFRNHSSVGTAPQEPWAFGEPFETYCRQAIELRYRLLPYLYTVFAEAARTGAPIARALAFAFPQEDALATCDDQFLLGADLLVAPIVAEGAASRAVAFPPGVWRDWWTGERIQGPCEATVRAPLDVLPLYVREGAIVPTGAVMQYIGERTEEPLTLLCALGPDLGATATGDLYEDDGETLAYTRGEWRRTHFVAERSPEGITVRAEAPEGAYAAPERAVMVEVRLPRVGTPPLVGAVRLAGAEVHEVEAVVVLPAEVRLRLPLGRLSAPWELTVPLA